MHLLGLAPLLLQPLFPLALLLQLVLGGGALHQLLTLLCRLCFGPGDSRLALRGQIACDGTHRKPCQQVE